MPKLNIKYSCSLESPLTTWGPWRTLWAYLGGRRESQLMRPSRISKTSYSAGLHGCRRNQTSCRNKVTTPSRQSLWKRLPRSSSRCKYWRRTLSYSRANCRRPKTKYWTSTIDSSCRNVTDCVWRIWGGWYRDKTLVLQLLVNAEPLQVITWKNSLRN